VQHPHLSADESLMRRFVKEGYAANAVDHPGAVTIFDDDVDGTYAFLVMELLDGESLAAKAEREGGKLSADYLVLSSDDDSGRETTVGATPLTGGGRLSLAVRF
jgi:hypothetical protein